MNIAKAIVLGQSIRTAGFLARKVRSKQRYTWRLGGKRNYLKYSIGTNNQRRNNRLTNPKKRRKF